MSEVYAVDLDELQIKAQYFTKTIAWPVYAWTAILPKSEIEDIDILQKLVLSLAEIGCLKGSDLIYTLGISAELINSVIDSCNSLGYLKDENLTELGKSKIASSQTIEQHMLVDYEQIYIFRDALSGDIVPNYTIKVIPKETGIFFDFVFPENNRYKDKRPNFTEFERALKITRKINRSVENAQRDYGVTEIAHQSEIDEDLLEMLEDISWQDIGDDGELSTKLNEQQNENQSHNKSELTSDRTVNIVSNQPKRYYFKAILYIDADNPKRISMSSPFGGSESSWFSNRLLILSKKDEEIKLMLDLFMEEAHKELMDRYPFANDFNVALFEMYPAIANYPKWKVLRDEIEAMQRAYLRIVNGDQDVDTFYMRAQRTLECILSYCLQTLSNKQETLKLVSKYNFTETINLIQTELNITIPGNYYSTQFYFKLLEVARNKGNSSKDRALFLAFDAYINHNNSSIEVFRDAPDFYQRVNLIVNIRNQSTHFNENKSASNIDYHQIKNELDSLLGLLIAKYLILKGE